MEHFSVSKTQYGSLYSLATLSSGLVLPFVGPLLDRVDARKYSFQVTIGLVVGLLLMIFTEQWWLGFLSLFLLRLNGQSLCGHIANVTGARYFDKNRGQAMSLVNSGYPISEGLVSPLAAVIIAWVGAQYSLLFVVAYLLLVFGPLSQWLTRPLPAFNQPLEQEPQSREKHKVPQKTAKDVLTEPLFYFLLPHSVYPAFILTGFLIYQSSFAEAKAWPLNSVAIAMGAFALARFSFSLLTGPLVDRLSARRVFPFYQLPLSLGFFCYIHFQEPWIIYLVMALCGLTVGAGGPIKSSLWPELYGVKHIAAIKSTVTTSVIMMTALSSFLFGWLIDLGHIHTLSLALAFVSLSTAAISWLGLSFFHRH